VIFKSHILSMLIFAAIVSILLAFIKHNEYRRIWRYALKLFLYMFGGVIVSSWIMYLL
jgi:multisubunit Na+/H+ antiporter MnhE subunit